MPLLVAVINFEAAHPWNTFRKEVLIRSALGISSTRYHQRLNQILTDEVLLAAALKHDPFTVRRLLRLQEQRTANRNARKVLPT